MNLEKTGKLSLIGCVSCVINLSVQISFELKCVSEMLTESEEHLSQNSVFEKVQLCYTEVLTTF